MIPIDVHLSPAEVALWVALAFVTWLLLIALLDQLGLQGAPLIAAPISWVLARVVMSGLPELIRWASQTVTTMTG